MSATDQSVSSAMGRLTFLTPPVADWGAYLPWTWRAVWGDPGGGVQHALQLTPSVLLTATAPGFVAGCSLRAGRPTSLALGPPPLAGPLVLEQEGGERQTLTGLENRTQRVNLSSCDRVSATLLGCFCLFL